MDKIPTRFRSLLGCWTCVRYENITHVILQNDSNSSMVLLPSSGAPSRPVAWYTFKKGRKRKIEAKSNQITGMGDSCCNPDSMMAVADFITEILPETYVHSIRIGETEEFDKNAGFFGIINNQVDEVCQQLKMDPMLKEGFNAIGFSQGGQFLRSYVQRCNDPPVFNLITFGSQHMGVSDAPGCSNNKQNADCVIMRNLIKSGAYLSWVQKKSVQAQYYKDPKNIAQYLSRSLFLPDLNNERTRNATFKENLKKLNKLILIRFSEEETVVPAESSWFGFYDEDLSIIPMKEQPLYVEDWIGLRWLDERGRVVFLTSEGRHMAIDKQVFQDIVVRQYLDNEVEANMEWNPRVFNIQA
ncbi:Palmitoyl-protein thioesterase 1 [Blyttiomyces sp. JEL0837]|nr:Palmitoyl-protein thioesterase 1 [Blyttiomyces sp. JEL0837]